MDTPFARLSLLRLMIVAMPVMPLTALSAQAVGKHPSLWIQGGISPQSDATVSVGLEFRGGWSGRFNPVVSATSLWRTVGCDQVIGMPCDTYGWGAGVGALVAITPPARKVIWYAAPRLGAVFYDGLKRGVWNPSLGIGMIRTGQSRVGFGGEVRYNILTDSRSNNTPNRPNTDDYLVILVGLAIRL